MAASSHWSLGVTIAHVLLGTTVVLLGLDVFVDVGSVVPLSHLALVVTGVFGALAIGRLVASRDGSMSTSAVTPGQSNAILAILVGLLIAGSILRVYALGGQSFWFDEAISTNAAIAFLDDGRPTFPSGDTYWRALPHTLVAAGSMALFGSGEAAARFPSVIFGVLTIPATYWLGREVGGPRVGLLAAALLTFATWEIAWSRQARMYQLFQLLYVLALVLLLRVERTWFTDRRAIGGLVIVSALAALTHQIGYILLPVAVVYLGFVSVLDGHLTRRLATGLLVGSIVLVGVAELATSGFSSALERVLSTDVDYSDAYLEWVVEELHAFFFLGVIGAGLTVYRGWYRAGTLLVLAVCPPLWILSFHTELFATRYLYFAVPVLFVWSAISLEYVSTVAIATVTDSQWGASASDSLPEADADADVDADAGADAEARTDGKGAGGETASVVPMALTLALAVILMVALALGGGFTLTPQTEYELGTNAPQPDFAGAYEYVDETRESDDVIVAGWTAPGLYYAGGVDYWLAHDLTGSGATNTVDGVDRYAGATPIQNATELEAVIDEHDRGWVVADDIAFQRQSPETRAQLESLDDQRFDSITVFHWDETAGDS